MRLHFPSRGLRTVTRAVIAAAAVSGLSACSMTPALPDFESIGFREARYQDISAMRDFRSCRDEALELDAQARTAGDPARYLASARLLERCQSELGSESSTVSRDERMRAHGLVVQNYIKGGDAGAARQSLERFKQAYAGRDLYYPDRSSFLETMEVLLGQRDPTDFAEYATLNVSGPLKEEMRRVVYWKHN